MYHKKLTVCYYCFFFAVCEFQWPLHQTRAMRNWSSRISNRCGDAGPWPWVKVRPPLPPNAPFKLVRDIHDIFLRERTQHKMCSLNVCRLGFGNFHIVCQLCTLPFSFQAVFHLCTSTQGLFSYEISTVGPIVDLTASLFRRNVRGECNTFPGGLRGGW